MTTIRTLSLEQIVKLSAEARDTGDHYTSADCGLVCDGYLASGESGLAEYIDHARDEVRFAAQRIVIVIRYVEAREIVLEEVESNLEEMSGLGI